MKSSFLSILAVAACFLAILLAISYCSESKPSYRSAPEHIYVPQKEATSSDKKSEASDPAKEKKATSADKPSPASTATKEKKAKQIRELEDRERHERYANDGHPGTKPDDGLFGFDPWDDEDDAYSLERGFQDPYPDEW